MAALAALRARGQRTSLIAGLGGFLCLLIDGVAVAGFLWAIIGVFWYRGLGDAFWNGGMVGWSAVVARFILRRVLCAVVAWRRA